MLVVCIIDVNDLKTLGIERGFLVFMVLVVVVGAFSMLFKARDDDVDSVLIFVDYHIFHFLS